MSRLWYSAVLNWARYTKAANKIEIDFIYSVGKNEGHLPLYTVEDMLPIPGCEGGALRFDESVAIFGLGMYGVMAQSVFENIEPDQVYAFIASPGPFTGYHKEIVNNNSFILEHVLEALQVPLNSIQTTLKYLSDFVTPLLHNSQIILIPMGPKPHVLAGILLSMRHKEIACLRVSARRKRAEIVEATGDLIATRVTFT
jgi:hypothetical protein